MSTEHHRKLERMYLHAPVNAFYSPTIEIAQGRAIIEIVVREAFFHAAGAIHGSIYFKVLDDAAYFAVNSIVDDTFVLTASFNLHIFRPVSAGVLRAEGKLLSGASRHYVGESVATVDGVEVARGTGTFLKSRRVLGEIPEYEQAQ
ncbi:MAG TPA: PaaI family thioesterase [Anaerolineales bacterium]|nr:PaaI family thioesterase [Anaerolineales bacterium]